MGAMTTRMAVGAAALLLAAQVPAGEGIGPQGPLGPSGHLGPAGTKAAPAPASAPAVRPAPSAARAAPARPAREGNHIEASGNQVRGVRCGQGGASVNSVDVQGAQLNGRTVIVQGRNASDVDTRDCRPPPAGAATPATQINSIRIR